jgi:hypothetical protein
MTTETQQQQDDDFSAAFAQFGTADAPAAPVAETPAEPEAPEPEAPAATEPEPEAPAATEPEATEPEPEAPAEPTTPSDDDLLARLAALVKQTPPAKEEPQEPVQPDVEPDIYSADEKALLSEYEKDWPDVAKAEALRRRAEYRDLVNHVFREVAKELGPISQTLRTLAERTHLSDLHERVEDYDDVRDKVIDWVNNQPTYLQNAYKHVIQQGTPDEIADLVTRYKNETAPTKPTATTPKTEAELPATTKQAVAALAPVSSKRSTIVQADDPNDFEGAFAAFAKQS